MKPVKTYPEYSKLQKERIVNSFLEFYKDGKYAFDENKKKQSQGYYNSKSEILKGIETWCEEDTFVKYLIPILDYNLETDQSALEDEWVKNHKLQIARDDYKDEVERLNKNINRMAEERAKELHAEWVSDKEDVMNLQNALDESEQKRIAGVRRAHIKMEGLSNKLDNAMKVSEQHLTELRDLRTKACEEDFKRAVGKDDKSKLTASLDKLRVKYDKAELSNERLKMENELLKMKIKSETAELRAKVKYLQHEVKHQQIQAKWELSQEAEGSPPPSP
tara:strand:+ start:571 stop:1401 length:831 start_codon:yes stop_codon:yes gene_type:complete